jgi:hypothetical protein
MWEAAAFQRVSACASGRRAGWSRTGSNRRPPECHGGAPTRDHSGCLRIRTDSMVWTRPGSSGAVLRVDFELDLNSPISCNPVVPDGQLARYAD